MIVYYVDMRITHIAILTHNLERLRNFYETYFQAQSGILYTNPNKGLMTYFLSFSGDTRLEIMQLDSVSGNLNNNPPQTTGFAHLAFSIGSETAVDALTSRVISDGFTCLDGPRHTGDGYYESVILDPDGNRIEITV